MMHKIDSIRVKVAPLMRSQTLLVTITGKRRLGLRIAIGVQLIKLAARVIGMNVEVRGPFASGGEVKRDRTYIVGEQGAETLFPGYQRERKAKQKLGA